MADYHVSLISIILLFYHKHEVHILFKWYLFILTYFYITMLKCTTTQ